MRKLYVLALVTAIAALGVACASSHPDQYTNVTAPTAAGKTIGGKVVSFTNNTVEVETTTGHETLGLTSATKGRDLLVVGAQLAFAVEHSEGRGEAVVTRITANPSSPEPHR